MTQFMRVYRPVKSLLLLLLAAMICTPVAYAAQVSFRVTDAAGVELKDVLVIVQDLRVRDSEEVFRALTDGDGRAPSRRLQEGLYRVIATTPYGLWKTAIREFWVGAEDSEIVSKLDALGTHGYGDIVQVPETYFTVEVKKRDGSPASGVHILVRDSDATLFTRHWYKTDESGRARVMASGDVLVVVANGNLVTRHLVPDVQQLTVQLP